MPNDSTWDEVWAEYDARVAATRPPAAAAAWYHDPSHDAPPPPRARRRWHWPRPRASLLALALLLVLVLGSPFGEPQHQASAGPVPQRHSLVVVGLSGQTDMAESPALPPPPMLVAATPAEPAPVAEPPPARSRAMTARRGAGEGRAQLARPPRPRGGDLALSQRPEQRYGAGRAGGSAPARLDTSWHGAG